MSEKLNIVDNFISREFAYNLHNKLKLKAEIHPPDQYHPGGLQRIGMYVDKEIFFPILSSEDQILLDQLNLIKDSTSLYFNLTKKEIDIFRMAYTLYTEGQSLPGHNDTGVSKNKVYSAILYLTDDYEGGEFLWYSSYDWKNPENSVYEEHKPKSGQLYYFEGTDLAHHEVKEVKSGERSCIVFFYTGIEPRIKG